MNNNVGFSAIIEYQTNDDTRDVIWYDFDDIETLKNFAEFLPSLNLPIESVDYYKFIYNINKMIELDFSSKLAIA